MTSANTLTTRPKIIQQIITEIPVCIRNLCIVFFLPNNLADEISYGIPVQISKLYSYQI